MAVELGRRAILERRVGLRGEQAVRCFVGICRRSPLERRESQRTGAGMGSDKDGRRFSAGRSASRMRNPGVACHERGRVGAIERRVFLSSTSSCAEPDSGRPQDPGGVAGRVRPHLRHTFRLTLRPDGTQPGQLVLLPGPTRNQKFESHSLQRRVRSELLPVEVWPTSPSPN